jgi:ABC-type glycerol-3-phosphate transport system substrate-binding protein
MRKLILTAVLGSAALGLAACGNDADDAASGAGDTTIVETQPAPTATETTVVTDSATPSDGSTVSVGPDGASASIDTGNTQVTADTSGKATVKTN